MGSKMQSQIGVPHGQVLGSWPSVITVIRVGGQCFFWFVYVPVAIVDPGRIPLEPLLLGAAPFIFYYIASTLFEVTARRRSEPWSASISKKAAGITTSEQSGGVGDPWLDGP
jgi:hypothetical protein